MTSDFIARSRASRAEDTASDAQNKARDAQDQIKDLKWQFEVAMRRIETLEKDDADNKLRIAQLEAELAPKTLDKPKPVKSDI